MTLADDEERMTRQSGSDPHVPPALQNAAGEGRRKRKSLRSAGRNALHSLSSAYAACHGLLQPTTAAAAAAAAAAAVWGSVRPPPPSSQLPWTTSHPFLPCRQIFYHSWLNLPSFPFFQLLLFFYVFYSFYFCYCYSTFSKRQLNQWEERT